MRCVLDRTMDRCACVLDCEIGRLSIRLNIFRSKIIKTYEDYRVIWMIADEIHYLREEKNLLPVCAG